MTLPATLAPGFDGPHGPITPILCRLSPDSSKLSFWVADPARRGLYVTDVTSADDRPDAAQRIDPTSADDLLDLAWSGDGQYLAFLLAGESPRVGVVRVATREFTELPAAAFAWAGGGATLLVADPASSRLYMKDLDLGVDLRICEITDDAGPQFRPVISVSPDHRRFALVTRRSGENATHVDLAHHDGREWQASPVTQVPGTRLQILPFWTPDSLGCGLYVIDPEQHHSAMVAIPEQEGPGHVLYTSDSVDAVFTPAVHPDGRLIAFVRAHARPDTPSLVENRLVLLDPVEHAIAAITPEADVIGQVRWIDDQTLLVEGGPAVWTIKLRATEEALAEPEPDQAQEPPTAAITSSEEFVRAVVDDAGPALAFACEIPAGWERAPIPVAEVDFSDDRTMQPLALFAPGYATMFFTVAARPLIPGITPAASLAALARAQQFEIGEVRRADMPWGPAAETEGTQRAGKDVLRARLVLWEDGGQLFLIAAAAPAPLWTAVRGTLDRSVESIALLRPQGATVPLFD